VAFQPVSGECDTAVLIMDPLSITASIIAMIQLSGVVINICYDYRSGVKNAPRDAATIRDEVASLRDVLEQLANAAEAEIAADSSRLTALELLNKPDGLLVKCRTELAALEAKLKPTTGWKAARRSLIWPLKEVDVRKSLDNIRNLKAHLHLALTADQL
jgi:hypothetical protein